MSGASGRSLSLGALPCPGHAGERASSRPSVTWRSWTCTLRHRNAAHYTLLLPNVPVNTRRQHSTHQPPQLLGRFQQKVHAVRHAGRGPAPDGGDGTHCHNSSPRSTQPPAHASAQLFLTVHARASAVVWPSATGWDSGPRARLLPERATGVCHTAEPRRRATTIKRNKIHSAHLRERFARHAAG